MLLAFTLLFDVLSSYLKNMATFGFKKDFEINQIKKFNNHYRKNMTSRVL